MGVERVLPELRVRGVERVVGVERVLRVRGVERVVGVERVRGVGIVRVVPRVRCVERVVGVERVVPRVRGVDLVTGTVRVVLLPDVLRTTPRRVREGSSVSTPERCTPRKVLPPATTPLRVRLLASAPVLLP